MAWFASPLAMTGGPLSLFIDDAVRTSLNNLGLENRLNDLFAAGQRGNAVVAQTVLGTVRVRGSRGDDALRG